MENKIERLFGLFSKKKESSIIRLRTRVDELCTARIVKIRPLYVFTSEHGVFAVFWGDFED